VIEHINGGAVLITQQSHGIEVSASSGSVQSSALHRPPPRVHVHHVY
jgi:hypothetical protein